MLGDIDASRFLKFQKISSDCYDIRLGAAAAECGLSRQEAVVLLFFYNNPQMDTAADAARYRGFSKAFFSKAVEQLLRHSLITIEPDTVDRRCQHIRLTALAAQPALRLRAVQEQFLMEVMDGFSEEEQQCLWLLLNRLMENVENMQRS